MLAPDVGRPPRSSHARRRRWPRRVSLALSLSMLSCVSNKRALEETPGFAARQHYIEAAQRYNQAVRGQFVQTREHFATHGADLIYQHLLEAEEQSASGAHVPSANHYRAADALVLDAAKVGVSLDLPDRYSQRRRAAFDRAIEERMHGGRTADVDKRWAEAIQCYEDVATYEPSPRQTALALGAQVRSTTQWADDELAAGRYRNAAERASEVLALRGSAKGHGFARAMRIRQEAIARGSVYVAMAPVWTSDSAAARLPWGFVSALNDELELHHATQLDAFINIIDPISVRRQLRQRGWSPSDSTRQATTHVGREVGADYVLRCEIVDFEDRRTHLYAEERAAQTKSGRRTTYVLQTGDRLLELKAIYELIDVRDPSRNQRRTVEISASDRFTRGVYGGDPGELRLSRSEQRLFDARLQRDYELELEHTFLEKTSDRLARDVHDDIVNGIP